MISGFTTLFLGVGLAMYYNWKLALVSSVFLPFLMIGLMFQLRLMLTDSKVLKKSLEKSSKTAVEAITNIRTIAGLRSEEKIIQEYVRTHQISSRIMNFLFENVFLRNNLFFNGTPFYFYSFLFHK